jgi:hypothetical protein
MLTARYFWRAAAAGRDASITALLREIIFEPIPAASVRAADDGVADRLPPGFDEWLGRCLRREPERRFRDAGDAFAELSPVLGATGVASSPPRHSPVPGPADATPPLAPTALSPGHRSADVTPRDVRATPVSSPRPHARKERTQTPSPTSTPWSAGEVEPVLVEPLVRVGRVAPGLVVIRWTSTPDARAVARMDAAVVRAMRDRGARTVGIVPIVDAGAPQPDPEARAALARVMEKHDRALYGTAYVVLGSGFQAAAIRGAITGLMLLARHTHATKVFATVPQAVRWLASRAEAAGEPAPGLEAAAAIERF